MKVLLLSTDNGGSKFYRMDEPARVASLSGVDVEVRMGIAVDASQNTSTNLVDVHEVQEDVDLIVIQRPLHNMYTSLIKQAKKQGIATMVELDDDLHSVHARNAASDGLTIENFSGPQWVEEACREADYVSVSTPALLKYAVNKRGVVIRNNVPESIFSVKPSQSTDQISLGWSGSVSTHPDDLQQTKRAVAKVLETPNTGFNVVGSGEMVRANLGLDRNYPLAETGWLPLDKYYYALSSFIDIGIVPLELSVFNNAKSDLKGLEMGALGIPFVASPTPEYLRLEAYGIGKIARTPSEWRKHLSRWVDNPDKMTEDGASYRDRIRESRTYEKNSHEWLEAWQQAIDYRKSHHE